MTVAALLHERRQRERFFPACALDEPAWGILLETALGNASVTGAIAGAGAACATGLRHLGLLVDAGLVEREDDPHDGRRSWLSLTETGRGAMQDYLAAIEQQRQAA